MIWLLLGQYYTQIRYGMPIMCWCCMKNRNYFAISEGFVLKELEKRLLSSVQWQLRRLLPFSQENHYICSTDKMVDSLLQSDFVCQRWRIFEEWSVESVWSASFSVSAIYCNRVLSVCWPRAYIGCCKKKKKKRNHYNLSESGCHFFQTVFVSYLILGWNSQIKPRLLSKLPAKAEKEV